MELRLSARIAVSQAHMMGREIDHRVMNSLQFVSSMLAMQGRAANDLKVASELEIAANRIKAVARVHRHFYFDEPAERMGCLGFLRRLCTEISGIIQTEVTVEGIETLIPTTQIQSIGLLVNELITNAAKHGGGAVREIGGPATDGRYSLSVADEGSGLPAGFDLAQGSHGLGMKLISTFAHQLRGKVAAGPNPAGRGTIFTVTFPLELGPSATRLGAALTQPIPGKLQ